MKLNDAIRIADELRDNAISEAQKLIWINELEMKVQTHIHRSAPDDLIAYEKLDDENIKEEEKTVLLVPRPFDKVYYLWLAAMIDYGNAEYDKYQNDKAMADAAYSDYAKWFMRHFHDDCGNVMYIGGTTKYGLSAYQIAVNHGFEGTEAEWILSLNGKDAYEVAVEKGYQGSEEEFYAQLGVLNGIEERVSADAAAAEAAADRTEAAASRVETAALNAPKVENGNWWVYDAAQGAYKDTGVQAQGQAGEPGNGIRDIMSFRSSIAVEGDRVTSREYKLFITLDDGSTKEVTFEGGADGKTGLRGEGIDSISFSEETEEGSLYYARVGMKLYPILIPRGPKGADGKETVLFVQDNEPAEAKVGDLWFDTDEEVDEPSGGASSWNDLTDKPFDSETGQIDANCIPDTIQRTITGTPGDFVVIGEDGKATTGEPPAGGDASSWNDLTDKPFGESFGDTLTWDGDMTGRDSAEEIFWKVSDATPARSDFENGFRIVTGTGAAMDAPADIASSLLLDRDGALIITEDGSEDSFPLCLVHYEETYGMSPGTWFTSRARFGFLDAYTASLTINGYTDFVAVKKLDEKYLPSTIGRNLCVTITENTDGMLSADTDFNTIVSCYVRGGNISVRHGAYGYLTGSTHYDPESGELTILVWSGVAGTPSRPTWRAYGFYGGFDVWMVDYT